MVCAAGGDEQFYESDQCLGEDYSGINRCEVLQPSSSRKPTAVLRLRCMFLKSVVDANLTSSLPAISSTFSLKMASSSSTDQDGRDVDSGSAVSRASQHVPDSAWHTIASDRQSTIPANLLLTTYKSAGCKCTQHRP